ncbi:hypothetical protein MTO96_001824 [Rhipicephalus appendiculatus]
MSAKIAEQAAIALVLLGNRRSTIQSDSRSAFTAFAKGTIWEPALRITRALTRRRAATIAARINHARVMDGSKLKNQLRRHGKHS